MRSEPAKREPSPIYLLALWFVTEILQRSWTDTDGQGMHLRHASDVYRQYGTTDVMGCVEAARAGLLGDEPITLKTLLGIRGGEPSLMDRWIAYRDTPPPIYLQEARREWIKRTRRSDEDSEGGDADLSLRTGEVRPAVRPPED